MTMTLQPVQIATGSSDCEGRLVFADGLLVAVLVRLAAAHDVDAGKWFLEVGFGPVDDPHAPLFDDLAAAEIWIADQLATREAEA